MLDDVHDAWNVIAEDVAFLQLHCGDLIFFHVVEFGDGIWMLFKHVEKRQHPYVFHVSF